MSAPPDIVDLVDSIDAGVIGVTTALVVAHVNDAAETMLERSRSRLVGRPLADTDPGLALLAGRVIAGGTAVHEEVATHAGRRLVVASPWWSGGAVRGAVLLVGATRALDATEARDDVAVLAAGLAHEIRNPLAALRGAAELLSQELEGGAAASPEYPALILREAARVDALVARMLDLARPPTFAPVPIPVAELVHELALSARALAGVRRVAVVVEERYDPALPPLRADRARLYEALLNLVKNAVEALPASGGSVLVAAQMESELRRRHAGGRSMSLLRLTVRDDGPGLGGQEPRLFTPFFTTKAGGTGLGLPLARQTIEAHGGVLTVRELTPRDDAPGRPGTEAIVLLPLEVGHG